MTNEEETIQKVYDLKKEESLRLSTMNRLVHSIPSSRLKNR